MLVKPPDPRAFSALCHSARRARKEWLPKFPLRDKSCVLLRPLLSLRSFLRRDCSQFRAWPLKVRCLASRLALLCAEGAACQHLAAATRVLSVHPCWSSSFVRSNLEPGGLLLWVVCRTGVTRSQLGFVTDVSLHRRQCPGQGRCWMFVIPGPRRLS